jgi:hypothetical protein
MPVFTFKTGFLLLLAEKKKNKLEGKIEICIFAADSFYSIVEKKRRGRERDSREKEWMR